MITLICDVCGRPIARSTNNLDCNDIGGTDTCDGHRIKLKYSIRCAYSGHICAGCLISVITQDWNMREHS